MKNNYIFENTSILENCGYYVNLGWASFLVKLQPELIMEDDLECFGVTDMDTHSMTLCTNQPPNVFIETFLHEIVHALLRSWGIEDYVSMTEEEIVIFFSRAIKLFSRLNPKLARTLL